MGDGDIADTNDVFELYRADFKTGDWRTFVPEFVEENCIQCMFCWIYCPDSAIEIDTTGDKPIMKGIILDHCKGCGICASVCARGAIDMQREPE